MAFVHLADGELHYQLDGPEDAPVLVLSNSLGTDLHMWDIQIPGLEPRGVFVGQIGRQYFGTFHMQPKRTRIADSLAQERLNR